MDDGHDDAVIAAHRRYWDQHGADYDRGMAKLDGWFFVDGRRWMCERARGDVLEVGIGSGLNLPHYPAGTRLVGLDLSPRMLARARDRADRLGMPVRLHQGEVGRLPFADQSFDTAAAALLLCSVPDVSAALAEMRRVLKPGGRLLLLDHVQPSSAPLRLLFRGLQWCAHRFQPESGENFLRRPYAAVRDGGFTVEERVRTRGGAVERIAAVRGDD